MANTIPCKLYIDSSYYRKLNETGQSLFERAINSNLFYTTFPAELQADSDLVECIIAFCEVTLIALNDVYGITDDTKTSCEIFRFGQSENLFTLLITINYPNDDELYHDMMNFEILEDDENAFRFKLLGDQTLFAQERI